MDLPQSVAATPPARRVLTGLVLLAAVATAFGCGVDLNRGTWHWPRVGRLGSTSSTVIPQPATVTPQPAVVTPQPAPVRPAATNPSPSKNQAAPPVTTQASLPVQPAPAAAQPRVVLPPRAPLPPPNYADWDQNFVVHWNTHLGAGGAELPQVARAPRAVPQEHWFTRLEGVYFPPANEEGGEEIVFIGSYDPTRTVPLDPEDLLDAFAVAYRTWWLGEQRGVSFEPQPGNFKAPHEVKFFGGIGGSEVGMVAFESDRLMKCLSLGRENQLDQPFTCSVPGYLNKFALLRRFPGKNSSQHRFWFEPNQPQAAESADRRLVLAESLLQVLAKDETSGHDAPADQASQAFASHLTNNFDAYAVDPVLKDTFSRLHAYTVLFAVTGKLRGAAKPTDAASPANPFVPGWLTANHRVRQVATPATTPAIEHSETDSRGTQTITGGVRMDADKPQAWPASPTDSAHRDLSKEMLAAPRARYWRWTTGKKSYGAVRLGRISDFKAWHTDLSAPTFALVRETIPADGKPGELGRNWQLRMPRLRFSPEKATLSDKQGKKVQWPATVRIEDGFGAVHYLLPGGKQVQPDGTEIECFLSRDGQRTLLPSKEGFFFCEGKFAYLNQNGVWSFGPVDAKARLVRFARDPNDKGYEYSAEAKYRAESMESPTAPAIQYGYEDSRLKTISVDSRLVVSFQYASADQRISRAELADKSAARNYRYTSDQTLTHVFDDQSARLVYRYDADNGRLIALEAPLREPAPLTAQLAVQDSNRARSEVRGARLSNIRQVEVKVGDNRKLEIMSDSNKLPDDLLSVDRDSRSNEDLKQQLQQQIQLIVPEQAKVILVSGGVAERHQLAEILAAVRDNEAVVATENFLTAANKFADDVPKLNNLVQVIFNENLVEAKEKELQQQLRALAEAQNNPDAKVVLIVAHRGPAFLERLQQLRSQKRLEGKCVILLTCRSKEPISDAVLVEEMLRNGGAITVSRSPVEINQLKMPEAVEKLLQQIQQLPTEATPAEILKAIDKARMPGVELLHQAHQAPVELRHYI